MNHPNPFPFWIDETITTAEHLETLARQHHLTRASVQDCLDPEHYPKFEVYQDTVFLIIRFFDEHADPDADELRAMTRKMAFFYRKNQLITIHRGTSPFIEKIRNQWQPEATIQNLPQAVMIKVIKKCLDSYLPLLLRIENELLGIEKNMFLRRIHHDTLIKLHQCRTKISVAKRLLWHSSNTIQQLSQYWIETETQTQQNPWIQDLKETAESHHRYADELMDDTENLLHLHISLASQRTNEVMRFLTVVSLFFLPLTFIVGVYGMNFKFMPELEHVWGYPAALGLMAAVSLFIFYKVKRRGWLNREH